MPTIDLDCAELALLIQRPILDATTTLLALTNPFGTERHRLDEQSIFLNFESPNIPFDDGKLQLRTTQATRMDGIGDKGQLLYISTCASGMCSFQSPLACRSSNFEAQATGWPVSG